VASLTAAAAISRKAAAGQMGLPLTTWSQRKAESGAFISTWKLIMLKGASLDDRVLLGCVER
jgi:hypothetical protein